MKRAYTNGILLDGTEQMQPTAHKIVLTEGDTITVTGLLKNYKGTVEFDKGCTLDAVVK